jgi:hypothetical protein
MLVDSISKCIDAREELATRMPFYSRGGSYLNGVRYDF